MTEPSADPFALFDSWFAEAQQSEPNDPNAMALATATPGGAPSVRMVLLKGVDPDGHPERGFVFYTNLESRKGVELAANKQVALLFHWKSLRRQIRIEGAVQPVTEAEADAYFASRPRLSQLGAWASDQSRPLADRAMLERRLAEAEKRFIENSIPRPLHWGGFRVCPKVVEFWSDRPFRLHERLIFRSKLNGWESWHVFP